MNKLTVGDLINILQEDYDPNAIVVGVDWGTGNTYDVCIGGDDEDEGTEYCRISFA